MNVKFVSCTAAQFERLAEKDEGTLYFITDTQELYKGSLRFGVGK